ncbi:hypothetical protein [Sinomonas soli]
MTAAAILTDEELTAWLKNLQHDAQAAQMAAAKATGDQNTLTMLSSAADVARRRAEWLRSRALPAGACMWCSAVERPCAECTPKPKGDWA